MKKEPSFFEKRVSIWVILVTSILTVIFVPELARIMGRWTWREIEVSLLCGIYIVITGQALVFLYWILFAWNNPDRLDKNRAPKVFKHPLYSFTALLPVRHETAVIADTIKAIANVNYPNELKQLIVITHDDDPETIAAAQAAIAEYGAGKNIKLMVNSDRSIMNKPRQMNFALQEATGDIVVPFDGEDQPHPDLYNVVNTTLLEEKVDIVQAGVQLMNYKSKWFSALNCLEYFFWFKSAMHFFAGVGVIPLGGNTVFFKRTWLTRVGGWDETCLTEDAEIGIRMSIMGAKVAVVYDEKYATQEETPASLWSFIKQRTRWHQGFLQILAKGYWRKFPNWKHRVLAGYILALPEILTIMLWSVPGLLAMGIKTHLPMAVALLSFIPLALLILQVVITVTGLWQFTKDYQKPWPILTTLGVVLAFIPYLTVLSFGTLRAMIRHAAGTREWEKTKHTNAHRAIGSVALRV